MSNTTLTTGELHTSKGVLKFELYNDDTPIAVANFTKLINEGFYNGLPSTAATNNTPTASG